jgi:hypothetical protein
MTQPIEAATKITVTTIAGNGAHYLAVASSAAGLSQQLNQTHNFLYLDLPVWVFFSFALVLAAIGSLGSLYTDVMKQTDITGAQMAANLVLGFFAGVIGAFVILPAITTPPISIVLVTALILSFIGTVLIKNMGDLVRSVELWDAIRDILREQLPAIKALLKERFQALLTLIFGGRHK